MSDLLSYSFIQNALLASVLAGICCGIIGSYMVWRRLVFLGGGITHSSLGGIGIAYWAGLNTTLGALVFAVISAFSINYLTANKKGISEDSAIGIIWSTGMALGVVFIFITPGYAPNLMSFLFGNLLLVDTANLIWLAVFDVVLIAAFTIWGRVIVYSALDVEYAASQKVRVGAINVVMLIAMSVAIVLNIKTLGIILMISMLTIPPVVVSIFAKRFSSILIASSVVAVVAAILGLAMSYLYDIPSAATSVLFLVALFVVCKAISFVQHKLSPLVRRVKP